MQVENIRHKYNPIDGKPKTLQEVLCSNIKASERLRCDINKEQDIFKILDMALLCISMMTNDKPFYSQNREKLINYICCWNKEKQ